MNYTNYCSILLNNCWELLSLVRLKVTAAPASMALEHENPIKKHVLFNCGCSHYDKGEKKSCEVVRSMGPTKLNIGQQH